MWQALEIKSSTFFNPHTQKKHKPQTPPIRLSAQICYTPRSVQSNRSIAQSWMPWVFPLSFHIMFPHFGWFWGSKWSKPQGVSPPIAPGSRCIPGTVALQDALKLGQQLQRRLDGGNSLFSWRLRQKNAKSEASKAPQKFWNIFTVNLTESNVFYGCDSFFLGMIFDCSSISAPLRLASCLESFLGLFFPYEPWSRDCI